MIEARHARFAQALPDSRFDAFTVYRWWREHVVASVDHERVVTRIVDDSGWSARYLFMTMMSAGIAVLGLLLSSPAVVIGAMLISPLMSPILGLGFSLALFDFTEMRRALAALAIGTVAAVAFTALIVLLSPLKAPTTEILARTRPNLFDLLVALFAALAGTFAIIRGRGETIVGVAIATALMPPLAVVGYGLATMNVPVLGGALALFATNFLTIALAATVMARYYGFGHHLSGRQSWLQTVVLLCVFVLMAVPLGISLSRIARETVTATQVRSFLSESFGTNARVTQLDIDFDRRPLAIRSVVIAPRTAAKDSLVLQTALSKRLARPVRLQLDQVLLDPSAGSLETQRAELAQASSTALAADAEAERIAQLVAVAAGVAPGDVTIDRDHRRATVSATPLPGAGPQTYRALERRLSRAASGWQVAIVPPLARFPAIRFADDVDTLDPAARDAVLLSAWEARRWNIPALAVPGLPEGDSPERPALNQRRGLAVAGLLREQGIAVVPAPAEGQAFTLRAQEP
ncbi:DUF389 domain-containing protein [Sphingomonas sp.]|uniref:DUF389 domain-containing protein n=1 Tax=Sphingomonas sp. TaxID=28214 RepID=UPI0035BBE43A